MPKRHPVFMVDDHSPQSGMIGVNLPTFDRKIESALLAIMDSGDTITRRTLYVSSYTGTLYFAITVKTANSWMDYRGHFDHDGSIRWDLV